MKNSRWHLLDLFRGFAVLQMVVGHFCYDLYQFGLIDGSPYGDNFWTRWRLLIVTCFMLVSGVSGEIAQRTWLEKKFWQRQVQIGGIAILISVTSYFMFPKSWIIYGILHFFFVAGLLQPFFLNRKWLSLALGLFFVLLPMFYRDSFFTPLYWIWTGLSPLKPRMEDFVPLLPWFGVVLLGHFIKPILEKKQSWISWNPPRLKWLHFLGDHALLIYVGHQMILYPLAAGLNYLLF